MNVVEGTKAKTNGIKETDQGHAPAHFVKARDAQWMVVVSYQTDIAIVVANLEVSRTGRAKNVENVAKPSIGVVGTVVGDAVKIDGGKGRHILIWTAVRVITRS